MFIQIRKDLIINTDHIFYYNFESRFIRMTDGENIEGIYIGINISDAEENFIEDLMNDSWLMLGDYVINPKHIIEVSLADKMVKGVYSIYGTGEQFLSVQVDKKDLLLELKPYVRVQRKRRKK